MAGGIPAKSPLTGGDGKLSYLSVKIFGYRTVLTRIAISAVRSTIAVAIACVIVIIGIG